MIGQSLFPQETARPISVQETVWHGVQKWGRGFSALPPSLTIVVWRIVHIIKEIKFPIYFIHSLFFLFDSPFTIYWEFLGDYGLKKTYFELPLQNLCQGICFRVKEYVLGSRNPMKWVSSLKQNIYLCSYHEN